MIVLAIDPGLDTGWAVVEHGRLVDTGLGDPRPLTSRALSKVIIERPQIYQRSKGDPNDLITLAIQVGRYTEAFGVWDVEHILPHTWKGTVDPDICCRRIVASLDDAERTLLYAKLEPLARKSVKEDLTGGKRHNVIDAVGIAKWSLKRSRAGVF